MNVAAATIEMDPAEAETAYRAYRDALRQRADAEYTALARGYRELAKGRKVIYLSKAVVGAGRDEFGRPRLAVVRADYPKVYLHLTWRGQEAIMRGENLGWSGRVRKADRVFHFPPDETIQPRDWTAISPIIPPAARPVRHLRNYYLLFEPRWQAAPHPDPMLLKQIGGDAYVVLAVWDLTPLELAVLEDRR